ncbi:MULTISPECIES: hypothetical protein [Alteromonadaceae]|uniref:hypothetical protein n=1 Tax=Alteromonadaceae TaxID=72275 RepID=UPI001C082D34|nr:MULTISPECIES: hypothetical protein [Aliiglaciecola]MBU2877569.1 hypothetical protein [Aliiglaciecola lipolytica]MDO6711149.1 hypothetical protein [Aliiglaciecola sp. 2_MG-2023]MDO6752063.1 hypothetical protein [Aliiglaciecola sp. 1_MG-2023]
MLSNTVVLFLKDALPIFWAIAILIVLIPNWRHWLPLGIACGIIVCLSVFKNIGYISELADGLGFEFLKIILLILCYIFALCFFVNRPLRLSLTARVLATSFVTCIIILNASNLLLFYVSFWQVNEQSNSLFLGLILGIGICTSIATLLVLLLKPLQKVKVARYLFLIFAVGQFSHIANLLQQTDLVTSQKIWSTEQFISDENEIGQFLTTLIGYESSPTGLYILIYLAALIVPILMGCFLNTTRSVFMEQKI